MSISWSAGSASKMCSWDSWAYFHLPHTETALGPPCSSLIIHIQARASWQVCWSHSMFCDSDNTFSMCGQKNAQAITLLQPSLVRPDWGRGSKFELRRSAWSWINVRPNNAFLKYMSIKLHFKWRSHWVSRKKNKQIKTSVTENFILT